MADTAVRALAQGNLVFTAPLRLALKLAKSVSVRFVQPPYELAGFK